MLLQMEMPERSANSPQRQPDLKDPNVMCVLMASWLLSQEGPKINHDSYEEERDEEG